MKKILNLNIGFQIFLENDGKKVNVGFHNNQAAVNIKGLDDQVFEFTSGELEVLKTFIHELLGNTGVSLG